MAHYFIFKYELDLYLVYININTNLQIDSKTNISILPGRLRKNMKKEYYFNRK